MHLSLSLLWIASALTALAENPILPGADPHAVVFRGKTWIFPTGGGAATQLFAWSSPDLGKWQKHGPILDLANVPWIKDDGAKRHFAWAPSAIELGGKFYLFYSVGPQNPTPSRIGVAVSDSPSGLFTDSGKPLITGGKGFEAIDPFVWKDPGSGRFLLYAGGSAGAKLKVFELSEDLLSIAKEIPVDTPEKFTEGPFVHFWEGKYYLSYSHGNYRDDTYSVHYSTSESATGPWKYGGVILASDKRHKGPGHHSLIQVPGKKDWLIVYHRWNDRPGLGPYHGTREVCIDRLEHAPDGSIRKVEMTDGGFR